MSLHYIADDLGYPRDLDARCFDQVPSEPTWLDRADVLLELDAQERLRAERIIDEIEDAP